MYAKNGSIKTILDHTRLIHGIGKNSVFNEPSQKCCSDVIQEEEESVIEAVSKFCVNGMTFRNIAESAMYYTNNHQFNFEYITITYSKMCFFVQ